MAGIPSLPPALVAFAGALAAGFLLAPALPPALRLAGLQRVNYVGKPIGSGGGLFFLISVLPWLGAARDRGSLALAVGAAGFGLLGLIDDRWGTAEQKGLQGHLRAAFRGRITTGFLKAVGGILLAGGLSWWVRPGWEAAAAAPLIALSANAFNLLDLRPLRTLKCFWVCAAALAWSSPLLAQLAGLSLPYARLEARRQVMLGDTGANLLGGAAGVAAALVLPVWLQGAAAAGLLALHLWAEKHSLTAWIEARPWARAVDGWGWRGPEA